MLRRDRAEGHQDVALGDYAGDRRLVVVDERGPDSPFSHLRGSFAQRVSRPERQNHVRHAFTYQHRRPPSDRFGGS
jgi:hypothetical protein